MKKLYISLALALAATQTLYANIDNNSTTLEEMEALDNKLAWVDEKISLIIPSRVGIKESSINSLSDPIVLKKPAPSSSGVSSLLPPPKLGDALAAPVVVIEPLRLQAMMNKSVLISGKWYQVGESVRNYKLAEIKPNSVLLVGNKDKQLVLFLTKDNNKIQITTK